jgi:hypothetical protein
MIGFRADPALDPSVDAAPGRNLTLEYAPDLGSAFAAIRKLRSAPNHRAGRGESTPHNDVGPNDLNCGRSLANEMKRVPSMVSLSSRRRSVRKRYTRPVALTSVGEGG